MAKLASPSVSAAGLYKVALLCLGLTFATCGAAWIDGSDGEVRIRRAGLVRFSEDPGMFKATLIGRYGTVAIMLATGAFVFALGGAGTQMTRTRPE